MGRKDFIKAAYMIKLASKKEKPILIKAFVDFFQMCSPTFNKERFIEACEAS